jgi:tetratricopeptide (TPR) repeat protein
MITTKGTALVAMTIAFVCSQSSLAAGQQARRNQQQQQQNTSQEIAPAPGSEEENNAFTAIRTAATAAAKLPLADTFLTTYPDSQLNGFVQRFRMESLIQLGRHQEALTAGEAGLSLETKYLEDLNQRANQQTKDSEPFKLFVSEFDKTRLYYYQNLMRAAQQLNDAEKTITYAEQALQVNPNDLFTLLTISGTMAERPPADERQKEARMKVAEQHAKKASEMVNALVNNPASAQMPAEQKASLVATGHQTLGLIYLHMKNYGDSVKQYLAAIAAKKDDPVSYYRLGLAYAQEQPPKVDQALDALAKSVFLKGPTETQAREILQRIYEAKNKSLNGLEEFITSSGGKI